MATSYTALLGLALPVTGELQGTWGDTVNNQLTSLLDTAVAGTTTISTDADVTLSTTTGAANQARQAIILWTANGSVTRNITAPAQSKTYVVINASAGTQSIVIRGAGPTTGVTVAKGEKVVVAWDGSDFVRVSAYGGTGEFTTVDTTNLEVTNIKAKDGTASATIADSTGVMTIASAVLTTADINGGTMDNVTIGGSTPAAGNFTNLDATGTLAVDGNVTLGDASTDTVTVNGYMGVGGAGGSSIGLYVRGTLSGSGTTQYGISSNNIGNSSATTAIWSIEGVATTEAASFTVANVAAFKATNAVKGAGSTITNLHGVYISDQTQGTNNYGITSLVSSGTDKWNIYASGTAANYFAGNVGIGTSSPSYKLDVAGAAAIRFANPDVAGLSVIATTGTNASAMTFTNTGGNGYVGLDSSAGNRIGGGAYTLNIWHEAAYPIAFGTNNTLRMTLDSSGNLGLGVTPSANAIWVNFQTQRAVLTGGGNDRNEFSYNSYRTSGQYTYVGTDFATMYQQISGQHRWQIAPSGTAGAAISFTQAMTLDASGNLGVGTSSPGSFSGTVKLVVGSAATTTTPGAITVYSGTATYGGLYFADGTVGNQLYRGAVEYNHSTDALLLYSAGTERARITSGGNLKIGGTADRATTEGDKQLVLFDGTAPVGTLANGISLYSSSGEAYVMDAAGNATLFSPHDAETNEWIFRSKHTPTGKVLKIDVERLLRFVNDHFGLDAVQEFIEN